MSKKSGSAPAVESAPHGLQVLQPAVLETSRPKAPRLHDSVYDQLALTYAPPAPVLTCTRVMPWGACKGTKFRRFAGPTGVAYRCEKCAGKADSALCSCSHGYGAHGSHGCCGVLDSGDLCECQLRGCR